MSTKIAIALAAATAAVVMTSTAGCRAQSVQTDDPSGDATSSRPPGGDSTAKAGTGGDKTNTNQSPGIAVSADSLYLACPGDGCTQQIAIRSTGTTPLTIYGMSLLDDANFSVGTECANTSLHPGETCAFTVTWLGPPCDGDVHSTRLVIHQNLAGDPTYIALARTPTQPACA